MREPIKNQEILNEFWVLTLNNCFTDYIEDIVKKFTENDEYNVIDGQDDFFTIPGRLKLELDGREAYVELSSDVLAAIYQIVSIKSDQIEGKMYAGEPIDLREYR